MRTLRDAKVGETVRISKHPQEKVQLREELWTWV